VQRDLQRENEALRHLLARAGLKSAEQEVARKLQRLLMEELHHRIKNTLATIQAIITQTFRTADNLAEAQAAIEQRLHALGKIHDLLIKTNWVQASLGELLDTAIRPYEENGLGHFSIASPKIDVSALAALPLAMALNELCTNAMKYGALSVATGHVDIKATIDEDSGQLHLAWTETGGPTVAEPTKRSFGSRLIEQSLLASLNGTGKIEYRPTGVVCVLALPLTALRFPGISSDPVSNPSVDCRV
jgi:two-component sensor histidine kinase